MKFVITGGGTAGHIYPALAVAAELKMRGHELLFAGTPDGQEARLVPAEDIPYQAFYATGFNRSRPWTLVTSSLQMARSTRIAKKWLSEQQPAAVAGFGGYVSLPVGRAAAQLGIPLLIHEQNSAAGWANRYLAKQAQVVALSYDAARVALSQNPLAKLVVTGNPVRRALLDSAQPAARARARESFRAQLGISADARVLLVFGGSQGAQHINRAMVALADRLMAIKDLNVVHITGNQELSTVQEALGRVAEDSTGQTRWHTIGYCNMMAAAYAAADLVVARSGAGSLAEIAVMGLPAVLVPYPYATNNHQTANAQSMVESGAAAMVSDADLDTDAFASVLLKIIADVSLYSRMQQAARDLAPGNAAAEVADLLLSIGEK